MSRWKKYTPALYECDEMPPAGGVYVIFLDGELAYIGQSTNLSKRMKAYGVRATLGGSVQSTFGLYKDITIKFREGKQYGEWAMAELRLLRRLNPRLNKRHCNGGGE